MSAVSLEELRDLFTGVPAEHGGWATTPAYDVGLAFEICRRTDADTEHGLRSVLFDNSNVDDIPAKALQVIQLAVMRYRVVKGLR